jgi:hypothetical protein
MEFDSPDSSTTAPRFCGCKGKKCHNQYEAGGSCDSPIPWDEGLVCDRCQEDRCAQCARYCRECSQGMCNVCDRCTYCQKTVCRTCVPKFTCETCNVTFCSSGIRGCEIPRTTCKGCQTTSCALCLDDSASSAAVEMWECMCYHVYCRNIYCVPCLQNGYLKKCRSCRMVYCSECLPFGRRHQGKEECPTTRVPRKSEATRSVARASAPRPGDAAKKRAKVREGMKALFAVRNSRPKSGQPAGENDTATTDHRTDRTDRKPPPSHEACALPAQKTRKGPATKWAPTGAPKPKKCGTKVVGRVSTLPRYNREDG